MRRGCHPVFVDESNDLLSTCFTLGHLLEAAKQCAKGVLWKGQVQRFMADRLVQCKRLMDEVLSGKWKPKPVIPFTLCERGKIRKVMPVNVRDRVVQRCLCDHILIPLIMSLVIEDCSACLKGRGLEYAIKRVREHLANAPPGAWVFQFDFHDYFHTIRRADLIGRLRRHLPDSVIRLVALSIGGETGTGIELGSHVCQILACWFPTPLDHLIQSMPGFVGYHRYMDDGIAIFETKAQALHAKWEFERAAKAMGLSMNPHKTFCNRATSPVVFCKTRLTKRSNGVRVNVRKPQTRRLVRHMRRVKRRAERVPIDVEAMKASCTGYLNRGDADLTRLLSVI